MSEQKRRLHFRGRLRAAPAVQLATINYRRDKQGQDRLPTIADLEAAGEPCFSPCADSAWTGTFMFSANRDPREALADLAAAGESCFSPRVKALMYSPSGT